MYSQLSKLVVKQVKVEVGQAIYVEKLDVEAGTKVTFDEVILVGGESTKK